MFVLAVHRTFKAAQAACCGVSPTTVSAAKTFRLPRKAYERKCKVLSEIYFSQTKNFTRWLPAHNQEGFRAGLLAEIEALPYAPILPGAKKSRTAT